MSSIGRLSSVAPTETLDIENGLSLVPRLKLLLTINRSDLSVNPIDEWQFKRSLLDYLKTSFSIPYIVPEEDLIVYKYKDLKKRKREDPVASGVLYVRDLGFLNRNKFNKEEEQKEEVEVEEEEEGEVKKKKKKDLEKKFVEWRDSFAEKLDGIELNLKGVKFRLNVKIPKSDDFEVLKKSWEEYYAFNSKGYSSRGGRQQPDTLVVRGLPSRWFAEPRVSSKPSMLVTHTIFSVFGKIRKLNVGTDDDLGENVDEGSDDIVPGLHCKIVVQFEKHDDFYNALKVLCGRSMQKEGSRLRADYEATWDRNDLRDTLQRTARNQIPEKSRMQLTGPRHYDNETPRSQPQIGRFGSNDVHPKRFKE